MTEESKKKILEYIRKKKGAFTKTELTKKLQINYNTVKQVIKQMVSEGFLTEQKKLVEQKYYKVRKWKKN